MRRLRVIPTGGHGPEIGAVKAGGCLWMLDDRDTPGSHENEACVRSAAPCLVARSRAAGLAPMMMGPGQWSRGCRIRLASRRERCDHRYAAEPRMLPSFRGAARIDSLLITTPQSTLPLSPTCSPSSRSAFGRGSDDERPGSSFSRGARAYSASRAAVLSAGRPSLYSDHGTQILISKPAIWEPPEDRGTRNLVPEPFPWFPTGSPTDTTSAAAPP